MPDNKKKMIIATSAVTAFAVVSVLIFFVAVPYFKNRDDGSVGAQASDEYTALLSDNGIPDAPHGFKGLKSTSYAVTTGGDSFETIELVSKKDTVTEMYDTVYFSVVGMTDEEYSLFTEELRNRCEAVANESYCTYSAEKQGEMYVLTMHFYALDNPQNVRDLITLGIISNYSSKDSDTVSLTDTETSLLKMGFTKR